LDNRQDEAASAYALKDGSPDAELLEVCSPAIPARSLTALTSPA